MEDFISDPSSRCEKLDFRFQIIVNQSVFNQLEDLDLFVSQIDLRPLIVLLRLLLMREYRI